MRILAIGDIIGESGIKKVKEVLPDLKNKEKIDFVIVNAENAGDGMGINLSAYKELKLLPIDIMTMGNHTWSKKDIFGFIEEEKIIRPANYTKNVPGIGYKLIECKNKKILVVNLLGRVDMPVLSENPFLVAEKIIEKIDADIKIVDFHAEATAEKMAMGYFLDGKVNLVFGTHTHVQTADEKILEKGTAYITDIGMTGPIKSIIGMEVDISLKRFLTSLPEKYKTAKGESSLSGIILETSDETNKNIELKRITIK